MKKNNRLLKNSEFRNIIRSGNKIQGYNFSFYFLDNNIDDLKIGITISKKVSKLAVDRNLMKRRIVAIINELNIKNDIHLVIIAKPSAIKLEYIDIKNEINNLFEKMWKEKDE